MKARLKLLFKILCNWRFLVCFLIAWMFTNGWAYLFIGFGTVYDIGWMLAVGTTYMAFLWMPFTPEKLITIPIALFLVKIIFPKQKELHQQMEEENRRLKEENKRIREEKRRNKNTLDK